MTKITQFFMRRPVLFWSAVAAILITGVIAFVQMPKLEDPAVSAKQAMVVVTMPGASAHEMELTVAQTVEDELRTLPDVNKGKVGGGFAPNSPCYATKSPPTKNRYDWHEPTCFQP